MKKGNQKTVREKLLFLLVSVAKFLEVFDKKKIWTKYFINSNNSTKRFSFILFVLVIVCYHDDGSKELKHAFCFSHTWLIYSLNTMFIKCEHTCAIVYIYVQHFHEYWSFDQPPFCFPLCLFLTLAWVNHSFSTYLEIPLLVIMVRISIHSRPWLVINCSPLASQPFLGTPHISCYMFTKTTSQHQLHCLIQLFLLRRL